MPYIAEIADSLKHTEVPEYKSPMPCHPALHSQTPAGVQIPFPEHIESSNGGKLVHNEADMSLATKQAQFITPAGPFLHRKSKSPYLGT